MTATNHTLTGILIAASVPLPFVSLPLAFLAHFALDALPHYGNSKSGKSVFNGLKFILPIDMAVASTLLIAVVVWQPAHWPLLVAGGVLCASPDLMWFPKFWRSMRGDNTVRAENRLMAFHRVIQWAERPWGAYVEAIWFLAVGSAVLAKTMY